MIYFLIPVYNESENIPLLSKNTIEILPTEDKFFVFVDDCSTDGTPDTIRKYYEGKQLQIITKETNGGPGDSFNKGFEWILNHSTSPKDIIVTLEGDNTSDVNILPTMIALNRFDYSLVLASVYAQGGGFEKTSFFRKFISFIANTAMRFIFDLKVLTMSSFYRVYSVSLLRELKKKYGVIITEKGFISMVEVLLKAIRTGAKIIEVPMRLDMTSRKGKSKMKTFKTMISYGKFFLKGLSDRK
jgi:dolichol-phosphate mannosyltransferase